MSFLPDKYDVPETPSKYMKLEEGQNRFRILSSAKVGYEWWKDDPNNPGQRSVFRCRDLSEIPDDVPLEGDDRAVHFWSFIVWNYQMTKDKDGKPVGGIQLLQIKQKSIQTDLKGLTDNPDWGDPHKYNITINKVKTGSRNVDVEYSVVPSPHSELDPKIQKQYEDMHIDLDVIYEGGNPFERTDGDNSLAPDYSDEDIPFGNDEDGFTEEEKKDIDESLGEGE